MSTTDQLRNFIVTELGRGGPELTDDYQLIENHVIDSLGLLQIVGFIETEYGITVPDEEIVPEKFATLASIAEYIEHARSRQTGQPAT
jgi:acyl carrier protein